MKEKLFKLLLLSFVLVLSVQNTIAQQIDVAGKVADTTGDPLPGVSIVIKGTTSGTVTDFDGNYTFNGLASDATLIFSFVGMKSQEVLVNGQTVINITMEADAIGLEEVVAVGYGTQKKSDITGSVASVKAETLEKLPVTRVDQALQGQLSGVSVQSTTAEPNAKISIRIRGANSINGGNDPLVVIDGFQGGSLNTLNPSDIKSIEVLKDASATAIYGSRGANGVILVTTKSGKKGKTKFTYNSSFSLSQLRKKLDLLGAGDYAETVNAQRLANSFDPIFSESEITEFRRTGGTDWQDEIFRDAFAHNHTLSASGGGDNISYYISGNLVDQEGILLNTGYKRYSLLSNISTNLSKKIKLNLNLSMQREEDNPAALNSFVPGNGGSPVFSAMVFAPTKAVLDENGNYTLPGGGYGPPTNQNPVSLANEPIRDFIKNTSNINAAFEYNILEGLVLNISGGYRISDFENSVYLNAKPTAQLGTEEANIANGRSLTLQNTNMLTYTRDFSGHKLILTAVQEQQYERINNNWAGTIGILTDAVSYNNLGVGNSPQIPQSNLTERSLLSYMGRINYTYLSKYLITLTARADASSVFGKDNKWGYFPSAAIGWNVTEESFMENVRNTISQLKLRVSYGVVGNQAIQPYQSLALLNTGSPYPVNGTDLSTGVALGGIANSDLKWEKTAQLNIGADIKFLEGRIEVIADYYEKTTSDLLLAVPLPQASGGNAQVLRNIGEVENKGVELYIGGKPVDGKFSWETGITFGKNNNKVLSLRGDEEEYPLGGAGLPGFDNTLWLKVGEPMGLFKGLIYEGVWKSSESAEAAKYGAFPGAPKFKDQNDDFEINGEDEVIMGNAQPDFTYGWNNTFAYGGFDLNVFIQGVYGNDIYNLGRVRTERTSGDSDATSALILNRWTTQNENTDVPSFEGSTAFPQISTSRWLEDGSYLRIKNISLGYTIPKKVLDKLNIGSARISFSGTNLFTFTDYSGFEPEASTGVDTRLGIDLATYPSQKIYTFGLDIEF